MSRAFAEGEYQELRADTTDPEVRAIGRRLTEALVQHVGLAKATAVLTSAVTEIYLAVLHIESPMPEANIASIRTLVDSIKTNTEQHEECAKRLSETLRAREGSSDEIEDVKPPTVH